MDRKYQSLIKNVIRESDMSQKLILETEMISVRYEEPVLSDGSINPSYDADNPYLHTVTIELNDVLYAKTALLSDAWVVNNILIFSLFDGWVEEYYSLPEGESFKGRCKKLMDIASVSNDDFDIMVANTYRLLRVIRNGIQHNLSGVEHDVNGFHVAYHHGCDYLLEFRDSITRHIYTIVLCFVQGHVEGISKSYKTRGHYESILRSHYSKVLSGIGIFEDDIKEPNRRIKQLQPVTGVVIDSDKRHRIENPIPRCDQLCYAWYDSDLNGCKSDYLIEIDGEKYLLPEEIGRTDVVHDEVIKEKRCAFSICFPQEAISEYWRII